jgi:hypothetical protein
MARGGRFGSVALFLRKALHSPNGLERSLSNVDRLPTMGILLPMVGSRTVASAGLPSLFGKTRQALLSLLYSRADEAQLQENLIRLCGKTAVGNSPRYVFSTPPRVTRVIPRRR